MKYSLFSKADRKKLDIAFAAFASIFFLAAPAQAQTVYFDPNDTGTAAGGSGEWNGATSWESGAAVGQSGGVNGPFVSGDSAYFDGAAGTVTVNAPVTASYLEVGVNAGTETFGTGVGVDAGQITLG